ncbi:MAG: diacylglycerol kinase family protein [Chloroflexi bacterium]|nr:diacylglycerol kinase family protein [Chloroflexota bacterium]
MKETPNLKLQTSNPKTRPFLWSLIFGVWSFFVSRLASFRHASHGWWYVLRHERNAWIHAATSIAVFVVGLWVGLDRRDWAIILLTMVAVWMGEFINTALEAVVDLASPQHHPLAKVGKDVGAAAVLIAALAAVLIGLLILGPPLWAKLFE